MRLTRFSTLLSTTVAASPAFAEGMPQLDSTWFGNEILWLAACFLLLFVMVSAVISPRIHGVLETRENAINDAIREAERAKLQAESARGNANSESNAARAKAAELMAQAQAENTREAADALSKLDTDLAKRVSHAAAVLEDSVAKANASIEASVQDLAEAITEKLLGNSSMSASEGPKLKLAKR